MTQYEYKVLPAPARGIKEKGLKTQEARFAHAIEVSLNELAAEGWEFHRAETLPNEERQGLTQTKTTFRSLLVFRRPLREVAATLPDTPQDVTAAEAALPDMPNPQDAIATLNKVPPVTEAAAAPQEADDAETADEDGEEAVQPDEDAQEAAEAPTTQGDDAEAGDSGKETPEELRDRVARLMEPQKP